MIHILKDQPTAEQLAEMLETLTDRIKLAVDLEQNLVAGGGEYHADCRRVLLSQGCNEADIWGATWLPATQELLFLSHINIRPLQGNPTLELLDHDLREQVELIVREVFDEL